MKLINKESPSKVPLNTSCLMNNKNKPIIRHANFNDIVEISLLLEELGYPCQLVDLKKRTQRFLDNPGYGVAVCEMNTEIVGLIAWSKSDLFVLDKIRFHIEALVVTKRFKSMGIGKKLMEFIENIAKQQPLPAIIDLTSGLRRAKDGTHKFYKSLEYQNEGTMAKLYLRKEL